MIFRNALAAIVPAVLLALSLLAGCQPDSGSLVKTVPLPPSKGERSPWAIMDDVPRYVPKPKSALPRAETVAAKDDQKSKQTMATLVALQAPYPQWVAGDPDKWNYIVLHHSADEVGSADIFDRAHRLRGWDELGYHFVIGNGKGETDGVVEVGPRWEKQKHGAHCRVDKRDDNRWNEHGIGICLVGNFDKHRPSEAQMASAAKLVAWLMKECHIPRENVIGHGQVPGAKTDCPGRLFPYDDLMRRVAVLNK
jgi:hypothetical protein